MLWRLLRYPLLTLLLALLGLAAYMGWVATGLPGQHEKVGQVHERPVSKAVIIDRTMQMQELRPGGRPPASQNQILFGDLHVHTTLSWDAFIMSLPILQGGGSHPPADACDFARFCSGLDFWGISDHAESLSSQHWRETQASIRQCNAVGDQTNPDTVAFLGFEWSQSTVQVNDPSRHYGHKNVFFRDENSPQIPARPLAARRWDPAGWILPANLALPIVDFGGRQRYYDLRRYVKERTEPETCPEGVASPAIVQDDCVEVAPTPEVLYRKLDEWQAESLIIPHGNAWGATTPLGATFVSQLNPRHHDPLRQRLIEVFSGHGNIESYRPWRRVERGPDGQPVCPPESENYTPGCRRAGQIIYQRCVKEGEPEALCRARQLQAQQGFLAAGSNSGFTVVSGGSADEWGLSGQCEDCFMPAFNYVPLSSAQYALALSYFGEQGEPPLRYRFGMIGSSDNHTGYPGTGYKEFNRRMMTETRTPRSQLLRDLSVAYRGPVSSKPREITKVGNAFERARMGSFLYTGGLVAVHSPTRNRDGIWDALQSRQVYATSGERILLWFDLLNPSGADSAQSLPMGSEVQMNDNPIFRVQAVGSLMQLPGCPRHVVNNLEAERIASLCHGECYHPSDERHLITRVEVVRIRPQMTPGEDVNALIEDPWLVLPCDDQGEGCELIFEDPDHRQDGRDALYYVRAIQAPTLAINGKMNFCLERDQDGRCLRHRWCENSPDNDCLRPDEERAWSSPIFVDYDFETQDQAGLQALDAASQ